MIHHSDSLFEALRRLPELEPDPKRASRTRARCHADILRRARRKQTAFRVLDAVTAAAMCAYLASVLSVALRLAMGV